MFDFNVSGYDFPPYRPPNEASSALIRVTRGCPWNKCRFCTMYKNIKFELKSIDELKKDIDKAAEIYKGATTVFIADSDSLVMKNIKDVISYIKSRFPNASRITTYARSKTLKNLGVEKLKEIKNAGLTRVHVGLESGDKKTLDLMQKGESPEDMIAGGKAAKDAGLQLSFYILIGGGGKDRLKEHAVESARICNEVNPDFIRLRTLVVQDNSLLAEQRKTKNYIPTTPQEKLEEVKILLENLNIKNCEFASDHFTNNIWVNNEIIYSGIYGHLPDDKVEMLNILNDTINFLKTTDGQILDATILYDKGFIKSL